MIDRLVLTCQFLEPEHIKINELGLSRLECAIDSDGDTYDLRHPWEKIPSSFSDMALKVWPFCAARINCEPFIEIKASPAKLAQGHNVYGSDDLRECSLTLLELLWKTYPELSNRLDISTWEVREVDITYHSWADSERAARAFINSLKNISSGQTQGRGGYDGTAYFGKKKTRIKKLKVYDKHHEILDYLNRHKNSKHNPQQYYPPHLMDWTKGMIRWEATLKTRWFERREITTNLLELVHIFDAQQYWTEATQDIFKALAGAKMKVVNDEEVLESLKQHYPTINKKTGKVTYGTALSAYRTFRQIKADGYLDVKQTMTSTTFYRHVDMISRCGLSKAQLQNYLGEGVGCEVIPLVRFAVVEFRNQFPTFAKAA